ncbi:branched-chain amino acid ABC transporter permease [Cellulomonas sp. PSBB021]|nr:branched-chain amino acid ABC transporter permease [Cellulomonas sp. PSBB021]
MSRRTRRAAGTLVLALVAFLALVVHAGPASAATAAPCTPDATTGCVLGTIKTASGEPAVGVVLTVEGGGESVEVTTAADGTWSVPVTTAGDYTVSIDPATLPEGETLRDPSVTSRTVKVLLNSQSRALFALGEPTGGATTSPTSGASTAPDDSPGPTSGSSTAGGGVTGKRVAQQLANGLVFGLLLALASVGLSLIYGTTGLSSFAHGEQVTLGAILAYFFVQTVGLDLWLAAVLATLLGAASGWLQDAGIWRPLRRKRIGLTQQMIVTIGLSMVLQYLFQFLLGGGRLRIDTTNPTRVSIGPVSLTQQAIVSAGIAVVVLAGVAAFLLYSRTGRATRAVSDNPALAAASGIGVERVIRIVWTGAAGLAALGGVLTGLYFQSTAWNMGGTVLLLMFASVTLGGLGTAWGALAGSIVIGVVAEMSSLVIPSDMKYAGALLILILVLLVRPQGILGRRDRIG